MKSSTFSAFAVTLTVLVCMSFMTSSVANARPQQTPEEEVADIEAGSRDPEATAILNKDLRWLKERTAEVTRFSRLFLSSIIS